MISLSLTVFLPLYIYLSLLPFFALIYPPPFPQAQIWLWGIDSDFIVNCYGEVHTIVLWWAKKPLIWQILSFPHSGTDSKTK